MKKTKTEKFINKARKVHGDCYNYKNCHYKHSREKVIITCKLHGDFSQIPTNHLAGKGCPFCGLGKRIKSTTKTTQSFINESKSVHGDKYDYSKVDYKHSHKKVKIICPEHGEFEQKPSEHIKGRGCSSCCKSPSWSYKSWRKSGLTSTEFDSFKVYIIRCWNDEEEFYKIGRTYRTIKKRFKSKIGLPYQYEVIRVYEGEAKAICRLEKYLQKQNKHLGYKPKLHFWGNSECFKQLEKL